ncbi:hypothetical protein B2J69_17765 [Pantoea latae]|uniref:Uncharacterized protein n=1 Tax=Pantoea latae TaxID=1964541 RepID=A0A1V9DCP7_9GAMM|nr:hypothetical protein B2J69_17765 [Pantoea latae]
MPWPANVTPDITRFRPSPMADVIGFGRLSQAAALMFRRQLFIMAARRCLSHSLSRLIPGMLAFSMSLPVLNRQNAQSDARLAP